MTCSEFDKRIADPAWLGSLPTPCYVFDPATVVENYRQLRRALGTELIVSVKANPNRDLLRRAAHAFLDGMELASQGELDLVVDCDVSKFVNTPSLDCRLLQAAIAGRATLVLDSLSQVNLLLSHPDRSQILPVMLRLNCGSAIAREQRRQPDHFGMSPEDLIEAARLLSANGLPVAGMHVFAGPNTFAKTGRAVLQYASEVMRRLLHAGLETLSSVNLGGGFPLDWRSVDPGLAQYAAELRRIFPSHKVTHEAGRAIFGSAGAFLTRVVNVKRLHGAPVVVCDGGMAQSFLLARTECLLGQPAAPVVVSMTDTRRVVTDESVTVVGSSCNSADQIGCLSPGGMLPEAGDFCVFRNVGAYHSTYTLSGFLNLPRAAQYVMETAHEYENGRNCCGRYSPGPDVRRGNGRRDRGAI